MNCLCILDNQFNFIVDTYKEYLIFTDYSKWSLTTEELLNVTVPIEIGLVNNLNNISNSIININAGKSTIIKYEDLPVTDCNNDGVYTFKITTCNNEQVLEKKYALLKSLNCAYKQLILKKDFENAFQLFQNIELIKASAEIDAFDEVQNIYDLSVSLIKNLKCNCNNE